MDVDLVNVFVEKQRDVINELMSKNVLLEARLAVSEKYARKAAEVGEQLSAAETQVKMLHEQNAAMNTVIEKYKKQVEELIEEKKELEKFGIELKEQKQKVADLLTQVNKLTLEKEAQRVKAEKMKKRAQELITDDVK